MKRKILLSIAAVCIMLAGALIWTLDVPHWKKLDPDLIRAQPRASTVFDADSNALGTLSGGENRIWIPLGQIPEHVRQAFLAAEDQRFYDHCGISVRRIFGAMAANLKSGGYAQGASTITQQLVKLTHLSGEKTLARKAQEAVLAMQLERTLTKDEILESYLNTVYFGAGAYGVAAAAQTYFGRDSAGLTLAQGALLAAIIKAPSNYAPHIQPENALRRRNLILDEMAQCGYITDAQAAQAKRMKITLSMDEASLRGGWYTDAVLEEAAQLLQVSADDVLTGGYSIHTGCRPALQQAAEELFEDDSRFPADAADGTPVQAALVAIHPASGEVMAVVGGRAYDVQRGFNRAVQMKRSPGSAIKPVSVYAAAIDAHGFCPTTFAEDTPRTFEGGYSPGNAGGNHYGKVTLREALSRSLNIATVDLADLIGVSAVRSYALRFGLELTASDANLALSLGSLSEGVSPMSLCAAYAALANGGQHLQPHFIRRIDDPDGNTVYQASAGRTRAVGEAAAYMLTDMLRTAADEGSAKALSDAGIPIAGKTGTVSDPDGSTRDIWTACFTPDLALTVWMGHDSPGDVRSLPSSEGGSGYPARLCAAFVKAVRKSLTGDDFVQPDSVRAVLLDALALENDAVLLASERTPPEYVVAELFHPNNLPMEVTGLWDAPEAIRDLALLSGPGEIPLLQFTSNSSLAEYLILRTCEGETQIAAVLSAPAGETVRYADENADPAKRAAYVVLPRHRLLYEKGRLLTGNESAAVAYSPGGLLELFQTAMPLPETDIQLDDAQSMFG